MFCLFNNNLEVFLLFICLYVVYIVFIVNNTRKCSTVLSHLDYVFSIPKLMPIQYFIPDPELFPIPPDMPKVIPAQLYRMGKPTC
jgi:Ca2+/Na+ antiporter